MTTDDHESETMDLGVAFGLTLFAGAAVFIGALPILCLRNKATRFMRTAIPITLGFSVGVTIHLSLVNLLTHSVSSFAAVLADDDGEHSDEEDEHAGHNHRLLLSEDSHDDHDHDEHHDDDHSETESGGLSTAQINGLSRLYCILCIFLGILIMVLFEYLSHKYSGHKHEKKGENESNLTKEMEEIQAISLNHNVDEEEQKVESNENSEGTPYSNQESIKQTSIKMATALVLHHFPEGIATLVSLYYEFELGVLVALALALHDVPSGISIATTIYCTTQSSMNVFWACLVAFLSYPLGAVVGIIIIKSNGESDLLNAILFGIICGILLFIAFCEVAATMFDITNDNKKIRNYALVSIFIGLLFMEGSAIILAFIDFHAH